MTKSSTFDFRVLESLWLVKTEDETDGMDFRVGFVKTSIKARFLYVTKN